MQQRLNFNRIAENGTADNNDGLVQLDHDENNFPLRQKRTNSQNSRHMPNTLQHQLSMSSIQSPMQQPGGTFNKGSCEDDPNTQEPSMLRPPQMMMQNDRFPHCGTQDNAPYYHDLKRVQDMVCQVHPLFPMQANRDFFDNNYEHIIKTSAKQVEFLFHKLQKVTMNQPLQRLLSLDEQSAEQQQNDIRLGTGTFHPPSQAAISQLSSEHQQMQADNQQQLQTITMLKTSLNKADDIVKNLRIENEYFQRQLESLRKEVEQSKSNFGNRNNSLDRRSAHSNDRPAAFPGLHGGGEMTMTQGYEPQLTMPQPMPHPRPNLPLMHDISEEPYALSRRELSQSPRSVNRSSLSGGVAVGPMKRQSSRCSNPPGKRVSATSANARKSRKPLGLQQQDENKFDASAKPQAGQENQDQEIATLKFEMQQQSEVLTLKTETVRNLQTQLDQQKRRLTTEAQKIQSENESEIELLRKELELCKADEQKKEAALTESRRQIKELTQSRSIEMNILVNKPNQLASASSNDRFTKDDSTKQVKNGGKSGPNKANKNLQLAKDLNAEMELMFADDDFQVKPAKKRGKNKDSKQKQVQFQNSVGGSREQAQDSDNLSSCPQVLRADVLLQNQIQAAQLAESLIDEIHIQEQEKSTEASNLQTTCNSLQVHSKTLMEEKSYLSDKVKELGKINDDLKRKFSALLDQFQEYVTVQESKQANDEEKQKQQQETLLQNMQDNIKELERVTESLQAELANKEEVFEVLKKENKELESRLATKSQEENLNSQQAMRRVEDELGFLKRHHDLEINMLKEQYERSIETAKLIAQEQSKLNPQNSQPQFEKLQQELADNRSMAGRTDSLRLSADHHPMHQSQAHSIQPSSHNQQPSIYQAENTTGNFYVGSHNLYQQQPQQPMGQHSPLRDNSGNGRVKDVIQTTQLTFEKLKKDLNEKEHLIEEKNREILHLRVANEEAMKLKSYKKRNSNKKKNFSSVDCDQRGQLVADLSYSIDQLRSELTKIKQTMFAQIGKHINFEAHTNLHGSSRQILREEDLLSEVIIQLSEIRALNSLAQEIGMLAQSSLTQPSHPRENSSSPVRNRSQSAPRRDGNSGTGVSNSVQGTAGKISQDTNYQIKRNADQMLRQNHASGLHELLLDQVTRSETLMNDNALMQRQLYKYETTLAELDVILRGDKRDQSIFELKKLVENQLKQIICLQKDVELARQGLSVPNTPCQTLTKPEIVAPTSKELESIKYQLSEQRMANEELIGERRGLMELVESLESQAKESHRNMEKALNKVSGIEKDLQEKTSEMEDIRERITKVAELFERKDIKQKYSFEVLCDFIHDKAKRLFNKYETVSKERKVMQEEKNFYFQRKLDQLEQENFAMKETNRAAERIIHELVPNLSQLLDRPIHHSNELSEYYSARQVLEQIEIEYRTLKKAHAILQERNNELSLQLEAYKATGSNANQGSRSNLHAQSTIENCAPNQQHSLYTRDASGSAPESRNPYQRYPPSRSPYDQKLNDAKMQEQQEIQASLQGGNNAANTNGRQGAIVSGHGSIGDGLTTFERDASPSRGHSPLRTGSMPRGEDQSFPMRDEQQYAHARTKSIERDNKMSPARSQQPPGTSGSIRQSERATTPTGGYFGMGVGSHLTPTENNK